MRRMSGGKGRGDESGKGIFGFKLRTLVGKEEHFSEAMRGLLPLCEQGVLTPLIGGMCFPLTRLWKPIAIFKQENRWGKLS
jgi:hypothetical protein